MGTQPQGLQASLGGMVEQVVLSSILLHWHYHHSQKSCLHLSSLEAFVALSGCVCFESVVNIILFAILWERNLFPSAMLVSLTGSLVRHCFVAFAEYHGLNMPSIINFKLST